MKIDLTGYPMMAKHEVEYIKSYININGVRTVLEWGSGNSTIWFPNQCPKVGRWLSIEHNGHYVNYLKDKVKKDVVELRWLQDDKDLYINGADGEKFDLILVDGQFREECWNKAYSLLNPQGTIPRSLRP